MSKSDERRKQAEELKARAAAAQAKERRIRVIGTAAVVVIVAGLLGIGVMGSRNSAAPAGDGTIPAVVDQETGAYTYNPDTSAADTLELWEDFQCPGCGNFEKIFSGTVKQLADDNVVKLIIHPAAFIDVNMGNNESTQATSAWGCALNEGKEYGWQVREAIFANQPEKEGDGWTNDQFNNFGKQAGLTGQALSNYTKCVQDLAHAKWAAVGTQHFRDAGIQSTPTVWLNGKSVPEEALSQGPDAFAKWIKDNVGK